ncbi:MAG: hypothetical protein WCP22_05720 [Chlamydiota bacterium]
MRPSKTRRGFSFVELITVSAISVILIGGILSLFFVFSRLFRDGSMQMNIQGRARYGIERIASGVSAAETIAVQSGGDRLDATIPATTLRGNLTSSATTIPVDSTGVLPNSGVAYIDSEKIRYGAKDAQNLLSCTRGYGGTTAASHESAGIVFIKLSYYLNGISIYLNADGVPNVATDERILWYVEKNAGVNLFQVLSHAPTPTPSAPTPTPSGGYRTPTPSAPTPTPSGTPSGTYRFDRVVLSFKCYEDKNNNNRREPSEPGLDFALEVFPRNN